jgi:hypothetical protein
MQKNKWKFDGFRNLFIRIVFGSTCQNSLQEINLTSERTRFFNCPNIWHIKHIEILKSFGGCSEIIFSENFECSGFILFYPSVFYASKFYWNFWGLLKFCFKKVQNISTHQWVKILNYSVDFKNYLTISGLFIPFIEIFHQLIKKWNFLIKQMEK